MTKNPEQILQDWEYQAGEMDARDPTRAQIMEEAAILRAALATTERAVRAALEAAANVVKEESLDQLNVAIKQGDAGLPYDASDWASRRLNDSAQNIRAMLDDPKAVTKIIEGAQDAKR